MGAKRNFGLDLLRAIAIAGVVLVHAVDLIRGLPAAATTVFARGWFGVDLFFVLSGYLIASQAFNDFDRGVWRFWVKRWTRTLPLYLVVLFAYAVLKPWVFGKPFIGGNWKFLFFVQNTEPLRDFLQSWSLCVEEQFYLLFPLAFLLFRRGNAVVWLAPLAISLAARVYYGLYVQPPAEWASVEFDQMVKFRTLMHLDSIAVGVFLAATRDRWQAFSPGLKRALGASGVALVIAASFLVSSARVWQGWILFTVLAAGFGAMLVAASDLPVPGPWLEGPVRRLALWSYGIYLWNNLVARVFDREPFISMHWTASLAIFAGTVITLSWLTYVMVEKPGMSLRRVLGAD